MEGGLLLYGCKVWSLGYFILGLFIVLLLLWLLLLFFEFVLVLCCCMNFIGVCLCCLVWLFLLLFFLGELINDIIGCLDFSWLLLVKLFKEEFLKWFDFVCGVCFVMFLSIYLGFVMLWGIRFWFDGEKICVLCFWNIVCS